MLLDAPRECGLKLFAEESRRQIEFFFELVAEHWNRKKRTATAVASSQSAHSGSRRTMIMALSMPELKDGGATRFREKERARKLRLLLSSSLSFERESL